MHIYGSRINDDKIRKQFYYNVNDHHRTFFWIKLIYTYFDKNSFQIDIIITDQLQMHIAVVEDHQCSASRNHCLFRTETHSPRTKSRFETNSSKRHL